MSGAPRSWVTIGFGADVDGYEHVTRVMEAERVILRGSPEHLCSQELSPSPEPTAAWLDLLQSLPAGVFPARAPDLVVVCMRGRTPDAVWWILAQLEQTRLFTSPDEMLNAVIATDAVPPLLAT